MPAPIIAGWIGALVTRYLIVKAGMIVASALTFMGLQFALYEYAIAPLLQQMQAVIGGISGDGLQWLAFFNFDKYITILLSAYTVRDTKNFILRKIGA